MAEKAKGKATKTYVTSDDGYTYLIDTIEHEGYLWLVPAWLDAPYQQMRKPARIIRLDKHKLHYRKLYWTGEWSTSRNQTRRLSL